MLFACNLTKNSLSLKHMIKKIRIKKWSTHYSVKVWDNPSQEYPRVRSASIDKKGNAPYLDRILAEEQDISFSQIHNDVETIWQ